MKTEDGYIVIGRQAYGTQESFQKALEDVTRFYLTGEHLPPLPYPTLHPEFVHPSLHAAWYPDVTPRVENKLLEMIREIDNIPNQHVRDIQIYFLYLDKFKNNGDWDLQVNHGLPGQYSALSPDIIQAHSVWFQQHPVPTLDQYAIFNGKVNRAGDISNYVYGFISGYIGLNPSLIKVVPQIKSLKFDNPEDLKAIENGYKAGQQYRKHSLTPQKPSSKKLP